MFLSPFCIAIISLREERDSLGAFHKFVRFALFWFCLFPLPLGVWEELRFVIVALPGVFSYPFFLNNRIRPKIKLHLDFIPVLITCKFEADLYTCKSKALSSGHFPHYKSMGAVGCHGNHNFGQICLKTKLAIWPWRYACSPIKNAWENFCTQENITPKSIDQSDPYLNFAYISCLSWSLTSTIRIG